MNTKTKPSHMSDERFSLLRHRSDKGDKAGFLTATWQAFPPHLIH